MGTLSKAVSKGFAKPSFRVIQNHFAAANNVGAVAAKEEVWEVIEASCEHITPHKRT